MARIGILTCSNATQNLGCSSVSCLAEACPENARKINNDMIRNIATIESNMSSSEGADIFSVE